VASLLLGRWDGTDLVFAGKDGTGFTLREAAELRKRLERLVLQHCPLTPKVREKAVWVKPTLLAVVTYREVTEQGLLRHAVFQRLAGGPPPEQSNASG
jgi:bifunctional non-homologous end joining protein LigD